MFNPRSPLKPAPPTSDKLLGEGGVAREQEAAMALNQCDRCKDEVKTYIPTHQYVKFDDRLYYVCDICWDLFRAWFHGQIRNKPSEKAA